MARPLHQPRSESELARIVGQAANQACGIEIAGGGTRPVGNRVEAREAVSTALLSGIVLYEPAALTLVVRAGTLLGDVEKALAREGQHLPFEPGDWSGITGTKGKSTIGGVIAAGVSGPRRIQAGAARDSLIGVRFVTGAGEIVKNGGRVMKNVTGYDLVKLMCGSHGTLGILTELSFKVLPRPETATVLKLNGLSDERAVEAMSAALASPFGVTGAAHAPRDMGRKPVTLLRLEGFAQSVKYRAKKLRELLDAFAPARIEADPAVTAEIWKWVRDVEAFHNKEGAVWRISVKPSNAPAIVAALNREYYLEAQYDWGGGLVWLLLKEGVSIGATAIRALVDRVGGHATLVRAAGKSYPNFPAFHPEPPGVAAISAALRKQFDPFGILNPGRMAPAHTLQPG